MDQGNMDEAMVGRSWVCRIRDPKDAYEGEGGFRGGDQANHCDARRDRRSRCTAACGSRVRLEKDYRPRLYGASGFVVISCRKKRYL